MDLLPQKIKGFFKGAANIASDFFIFINKIVPIKWRYLAKDSSRIRADKNLVYSLAPTKIPRQEQLKHLGKFLNPREKFILRIAALVLLLSLTYLGIRFYQKHLILLPKVGGTYIEGVVGYPQAINPLYASSRDVDADLSRLVYSSLFNYDESGRLAPDLAESWKIEDSGKSYIITLRPNVKWHSGENLSVEDLIFTVNLIKTPVYRSSLRASLNGVEIEKIDDRTVKFTLAEPYAGFLNLLTFGVVPQNAWEMILPEAAVLSELNLKPIGSGPYKFETLIKNKGGEIKEYHLIPNPEYYGAHPYISKIIFKFFPDYNELIRALNDNEVDGASYIPEDLKKELLAKHSLSLHNLRLPQVNSIFFNRDKNKSLADIKVRQALSYAIDRDRLLGEVLGGSAMRVDGPILANDYVSVPDNLKYNLDRAKSEQLLEESGYKKFDISEETINSAEKSSEAAAIIAYASSTQMSPIGYWRVVLENKEYRPLTIKLSVPENGRLDVAESIKSDWEAIGVKVNIVKAVSSTLNADMIAGHNFEAFLYGQVVGSDPDVASFWHSSQIGGQGLNLASYNNSEVDTLLTEGRQTSENFDSRFEKYKKIQEIIGTELPAIFLYSPSYTYVQAKRVRGFNGESINEPNDRLAGINNWYLKTKKRLTW